MKNMGNNKESEKRKIWVPNGTEKGGNTKTAKKLFF